MGEKTPEAADVFAAIPKAYCNFASITHSYFDFQVLLGRQALNNLAEKPVPMIEGHIIVQMSPMHFKKFANVVNQQLKVYEDKFGNIVEPSAEQETSPPEGGSKG